METSGVLIKAKPTVQSILKANPEWVTWVNKGSRRTLAQIERCRTPELGYHTYQCNREECRYRQMIYHSCRNRHCPNCGNSKKEEWIESRLKELLPCKYYHIVFTMPHQLLSITMGNRKTIYDLLFEASSYALLKLSVDQQFLGATPGIISVLHTWGQQLSFHPHIHCIVSGSGTNPQNKWIEAKKSKYGVLFPVPVIEKVYKPFFLKRLRKLHQEGKLQLTLEQESGWGALLNLLQEIRWVVDARQPMGGPQQVVEYLGRYTHKVAISNHRIQSMDNDGRITFQYKDYGDHHLKKEMTLDAKEFIRRFEQHLLPFRFCKIRHYGYLGNNQRKKRVNEILKRMKLPEHPAVLKINFAQRMVELTGRDLFLCPCCKKGKLIRVDDVDIAPIVKRE